jgi:mycofactocin precursor
VSEPITETADVPAGQPSAAAITDETPSTDPLVEQELLVEDVSIDGMCGVY